MHNATCLLPDTRLLVEELHKEFASLSANLSRYSEQVNTLKQQVKSLYSTLSESHISSISALSSDVSTVKEKVSQLSSVHVNGSSAVPQTFVPRSAGINKKLTEVPVSFSLVYLKVRW